MKKLILVTPGIRFNPMGVPVLSVNGTYMNAIAAAGGIPVMLGSTPLAEEYAEMAAGLVITGGESVHPTRYGETFMHLADNDPAIAHNLKAGCNSVRDEMEFAAFEAFFRRKKPILGICRGHQLINAAMGGTLIQDLPPVWAPFHGGVDHDLVHPVRAEEDTLLHRLYGPVFPVNSFHHQAVDRLGKGLRPIAWSEGGFPEAFDCPGYPLLGVQFHPERMSFHKRRPDTVDGGAIFTWFLALCRGEENV